MSQAATSHLCHHSGTVVAGAHSPLERLLCWDRHSGDGSKVSLHRLELWLPTAWVQRVGGRDVARVVIAHSEGPEGVRNSIIGGLIHVLSPRLPSTVKHRSGCCTVMNSSEIDAVRFGLVESPKPYGVLAAFIDESGRAM